MIRSYSEGVPLEQTPDSSFEVFSPMRINIGERNSKESGVTFHQVLVVFSPEIVGLIQYAQGIFLKSPSVISVVPLFE